MRTICFYLPQFHAIPENDAWWGPGFTDWANVRRAAPRFPGHYQPHVPSELGYYDLTSREARAAQAELARSHNVGGFAYYHYWFNGKLLLERPLEEVLSLGEPDFPFCLCWANENWTRSWDGEERRVLLRQNYAAYDALEHIRYLARAFHDRRYIRVKDRPLFLVYNPSDIPDIAGRVIAWREAAGNLGLPGLYLASVLSHRNGLSPAAALAVGFDASVEFFPSRRMALRREPGSRLPWLFGRAWNRAARLLGLGKVLPELPVTNVFSYGEAVKSVLESPAPRFKTFPCVMPSWDNSPRRRTGATVLQNLDPALYAEWLDHALRRVEAHEEDERIVFINAWNEWAEGCHLEPDVRNGGGFLEATRDALKRYRQPQIEPAEVGAVR